MEPNISKLFINHKFASTLWEVLKDRYDQTNDLGFYLAITKLALCKQGEESVTFFFSKLQMTWDELKKYEELAYP